MKVLCVFLSLGLFATSAQAKHAFERVSSKYSQEKNHIAVTNMPPASSQYGLGICYAVAASYLLQAEYCLQNKVDCSNLKPNETFSVLDLTRFQHDTIAETDEKGNKFVDSDPLPFYFKTLYLDGGRSTESIYYALKLETVANKECVDLEKFLVKSDDLDYQIQVWGFLKVIYNEVNLLIKQSGECKDSCSKEFTAKVLRSHRSEIKKYVNSPLEDNDLVEAFKAEDFGEFIRLISGLKQCNRSRHRVDFKNLSGQKLSVPEAAGFSNSEIKDYIYKVLKSGRPIGLAGICVDYELPNVKCNDTYHIVMISEAKDVCLPGNGGECRTVFKVLNTWGQEWQDIANDGWLSANTLLESISGLRSEMLFHFGEEK